MGNRPVTEALEILEKHADGDPEALKDLLRKLIEEGWPSMPPYSTLKHPVISEVATATIGTGVCPYFRVRSGEIMVVLPRAGIHYGYKDEGVPKYMLFGGFANLTETPGSSRVSKNERRGEQHTDAAIREFEVEEMVGENGQQILSISPHRLKPVDSAIIYFESGEIRSVQSFELKLNGSEVGTVKEYVKRIDEDPEFRRAVRAQTINEHTGKPEICRTDIVPLKTIVDNPDLLLHRDQANFFRELDLKIAKQSLSID